MGDNRRVTRSRKVLTAGGHGQDLAGIFLERMMVYISMLFACWTPWKYKAALFPKISVLSFQAIAYLA